MKKIKEIEIFMVSMVWRTVSSFGKDVMRTFERYFIDDKSTHEEHKNPYYTFINQEETCNMILSEFGLNPKISHIINGHVPVKVKKENLR